RAVRTPGHASKSKPALEEEAGETIGKCGCLALFAVPLGSPSAWAAARDRSRGGRTVVSARRKHERSARRNRRQRRPCPGRSAQAEPSSVVAFPAESDVGRSVRSFLSRSPPFGGTLWRSPNPGVSASANESGRPIGGLAALAVPATRKA